MNKQEELYFQALSKDRAENADMLEKPFIMEPLSRPL